MTYFIRSSWPKSLAALALAGLFVAVETAGLADDAPPNASGERPSQEQAKERRENEAVKEYREAAERAATKKMLGAMERRIAELREQGKHEEVDQLFREYKEVSARAEVSQWLHEIRARLQNLEAQNDMLRQLLVEKERKTQARDKAQNVKSLEAHAAKEQLAKEHAAKEHAAKEQLAKEHAAKEHAAKEKVVKEKQGAGESAAIQQKLKLIESELRERLESGNKQAAEELQVAADSLRKRLHALHGDHPMAPAKREAEVMAHRLKELGGMVEKLKAEGRHEDAEAVAREAAELHAVLDAQRQVGTRKHEGAPPSAAAFEKMVQAVTQLHEQVNQLSKEVAELRNAKKDK